MKRLKIIAIVGPTASGKSDLAIKLAQKINGEIISADSRQVYKGLDLGTGKVTKKEQRLVKHYLLDVVNPKKVFSAGDFKKQGEKAIQEIIKKNKMPIVVGGTGFYIDTLLKGIELPKVPANSKLRKHLDKLSAKNLFEILRKLDPQRAKNIDKNNKVRLIRSIEIAKFLGKVPKIKSSDSYQVLWLGAKKSNKKLNKSIEKRLDVCFKKGMIKEVKGLIKSGVSYKRLYDLGLEYRWVANYLKGKITKEEMRTSLLMAINQYAKRQMTWFKKNKEIQWITGFSEAFKLVKKFI